MMAENTTATAQPHSLGDLFISFTLLALQGFGGVLAVVQRELVDRKRWMTREQFVEDWAVAQILPGPNVVNLALMFGSRCFGMRGALVAVAGMLTVPLLVVLALAWLYAGVAQHPIAQGALRGMGAVAAGLITASGLRLVGALRSNPIGMAGCILVMGLTFGAIAVLRLPLASLLFSLGPLSCLWAHRQLGQIARART